MTQEQLNQLLSSLSTEEKVLQLCQLDISFFLSEAAAGTGPMAEHGLAPEALYCAGSVLCGGNADAEAFARMQQQIVGTSPHHIPALIMSDVIHGMRTIFPIPLAMAAAFDPSLTETMARISAAEAAACGIHVTFAPMADVSRDPRWGRCMESAGESVLLTCDMAAAAVRGFRGESLADKQSLACCVKHFAAYGLVEAGREYAPVDVSYTELYNVYFPPFQAAIAAGCDLLMPAFTPIDREPAVINRRLMNTVLRKQWGFNGAVISDWGAAAELLTHGVAQDRKQAAQLCMDANMDLDMMGMIYLSSLHKAIDDHAVSMNTLDRAVMRVLRLKNDLGLFETPYKNDSAVVQEAVCTSTNHRKEALNAALKSCVLLQNKGSLPLRSVPAAGLCGDMADTHDLLGGWAASGLAEETPSLRDVFPETCCEQDADVVLYATGETQTETGEAASKTSPSLSEKQTEDIRSLHAVGKKVVLLLFCGRPFILTDILPLCDAVLVCWFPGSLGARAIRMLLTGEVSPSGHLPMSFPRSIGQIPVHHDSLTTARPDLGNAENRYVSRYLDDPNTPLFPFGFGLSYTQFSISNCTASAAQLSENETLLVTCDVQNTGTQSAETVVQLYLSCMYSPRMHPLRELKAYRRIALADGEIQTITFTISAPDLRQYDSLGQAEIPLSRYQIAIGEHADTPPAIEFEFIGRREA